MKRLSLIVLMALTAMTLSAESTANDGRGFFRYAPFGQSLYADMHPNFVRLDIPYATNKAVYNWGDNGGSTQAERRVFTYNIFAGARYNTPGYDGYFSRIAFGVRAYHGNCPYGQFRSIGNYSQIGVCLMFQ